MRRLFAVSTTLLVLVTAAQFFLAAMGAFSDAPNDEAFSVHRGLGYFILFAVVAVTALGALVRAPGRLVALLAMTSGLVLLQPFIRTAAKAARESAPTQSVAGELVFGLHALNALAIIATLEIVSRRARKLAKRDAMVDTATHSPQAALRR